ncbi:hypothetical protein GIB67_035236, partial [Kingdonia uniflora]
EPYVRNRENPYFTGVRRGDKATLVARASSFRVQGSLNGPNSVSSSSINDDKASLVARAPSFRVQGSLNGPNSGFSSSISDDKASLVARVPSFRVQGSLNDPNSVSSSSISDDDSEEKPFVLDVSENIPESIKNHSTSNITLLETDGRCSTKLMMSPSFSLQSIPSSSDTELVEANGSAKELTVVSDTNKVRFNELGRLKQTFERTFSVNKRKSDVSSISLPQSAASFYSGDSLSQVEVVESCESVNKLNQYLKARKEDNKAGIPGKFIHAVIGQEVTDCNLLSCIMLLKYNCLKIFAVNERVEIARGDVARQMSSLRILADVGSVASTIMYAFYLSKTVKNNQLCTLPVINMKRAELNSHYELKWLFESCLIDQSSLIFIDEIDLSYYHSFGSLKLVLLNGNKIPSHQEALKEALIEIFNCKKDDSVYPWVETVTSGQDFSCCTLVTELFSITSPEILVGQGFSRLLLAAILSDTGNLKHPQCTSKDKFMATLLINGAGRFGSNGLYQILRYKMYDISELKVGDILRKDFKKWTRVGKPESTGSRLTVSHIGLSSIGVSVGQLLTHADSAAQDVVGFQKSEKLRLLMVVSGYYDSQKNFKREILVSAESVELMRNLLHFFNSNASQLPLKVLHQPGLSDQLRAFEIDNKITSRKTIERLLEEFGGTGKR